MFKRESLDFVRCWLHSIWFYAPRVFRRAGGVSLHSGLERVDAFGWKAERRGVPARSPNGYQVRHFSWGVRPESRRHQLGELDDHAWARSQGRVVLRQFRVVCAATHGLQRRVCSSLVALSDASVGWDRRVWLGPLVCLTSAWARQCWVWVSNSAPQVERRAPKVHVNWLCLVWWIICFKLLLLQPFIAKREIIIITLCQDHINNKSCYSL